MATITLFVGFLAGLCAGGWLEYRNGHLDRQLRKPWPVPQPAAIHEDFIDCCMQFNGAMMAVPVDQRVFEVSETIQ